VDISRWLAWGAQNSS